MHKLHFTYESHDFTGGCSLRRREAIEVRDMRASGG